MKKDICHIEMSDDELVKNGYLYLVRESTRD